MRFSRVLFVLPDYPGQHFKRSSLPIGIGYLAESLKGAGIESFAIDAGEQSSRGLRRILKKVAPDLVAVSMMTFRYRHHYSLVRRLKEMAPQSLIVAGGPHVSLFGSQVLEQCAELDYAIEGEGEISLRLLCEGAELGSIAGLHYREGGQRLFAGANELLRDLDAIAFPTYQGFQVDRPRAISLCSSRGCPSKCTFCQSTNMGKRWRARSPQNVADELEYWYRRGRRLFDFVDDNLTLDKNRVLKICDEIDRRALTGLAIGAAGVRADCVDREIMERMKAVGFSHLSFGVEGGNDRILDILKKGESFESIDSAVRNATELGYHVTLYFLVGSPYETLDDVRDSCHFALKYPITDAFFSNLMPIPGTEIMDWIVENGRLIRQPEDYLNAVAEFERVPLFEGPGMTYTERLNALAITEQVRAEVRRRFLCRYAEKRGDELTTKFIMLRAVGRLCSYAGARTFLSTVLRRAIIIWYKLRMVAGIS